MKTLMIIIRAEIEEQGLKDEDRLKKIPSAVLDAFRDAIKSTGLPINQNKNLQVAIMAENGPLETVFDTNGERR